MLHTKFRGIGLSVPKKKIFERFLPYMGMAAILVMWPRCREQTFVPTTQGVSTVVSEKIQFDFCCMYTTLSQGQEMTLTFNTHISSLNLFVEGNWLQ